MRRSVGYCMNEACSDSACTPGTRKGDFLVNHGSTFHCPRCKVEGFIEAEGGTVTGKRHLPFKEARVKFDFDPCLRIYRGVAIVRDEMMSGPGRVYELQSPLIRTEKRALKVAESILASISRAEPDMTDSIPSFRETVLDLEARDYTARLRQFEIDLARSVR
jgi:hypothetical protein